ncbi:DUF4167 domain-containing protein [Aliirhizobium smilacinae]|uniref:DUF4167 domain-containing protein n=1 Tax=Aliirhizobium smilacinae TaxID=1395944 RepID=A0A5C4XA29_9HYPH|nr:DUF4167 domain-containing protein [Rhizobium smilacinae]
MNSPHRNSRPSTSRPARGNTVSFPNPSSQSLTKRYEQYILLARETAQAGDRVEAENLYQHAEHFYRTAALQKAGLQQ